MYGTISFPGLGLSFNPSRVAFSIGSKPIYWYGIIIAVGFLLAVYYAMKRADQFGLTQDNWRPGVLVPVFLGPLQR